MGPLEALAADQRAVLQLVLKQGRSYDDLAALLRIDRDAVRNRARAGLDALGPEAGRRLSPQRRGEIADYLLGQQETAEHEATLDLLSSSAGARAWARVVSGELAPLARAPLPVVPADGPELESPLVEDEPPVAEAPVVEPPVVEPLVAEAPVFEPSVVEPPVVEPPPPPAAAEPAPPPPSAPAAADEPGPSPGGAPAEATPAPGPVAERRPGEADGDLLADAAAPPSSRLGGLFLLGGLGILVVVAVIVLVSGGSRDSLSPTGSSPTTATGPAPTATGQTTPGGQAQAVPRQQINFTATAAGGNARGNAILFNQSGQNRMLVQATSLPPNARGTFYAVWVYATPGVAQVLGFQRVGANGRFSAVAPAPPNVMSFGQVLITREKPTKSNQAPTTPGPVFLEGSIKKG